MTLSLTAPVRRGLALLILLVVTLAVWQVVVSPVIELSRSREADIALLTNELERLEATRLREKQLAGRAEQLKTEIAAEGGFWAGPSTTAVAAKVQDRLREAVSSGGGKMNSASELRQINERGFLKVTLRFSIQGTLETVQQTLEAIETTTPALFVDGFTITAPEPMGTPTGPPTLNLDVDVVGYMQAPRS
jgi:hypothetical protein